MDYLGLLRGKFSLKVAYSLRGAGMPTCLGMNFATAREAGLG